jgi:hypothetical protein
MAKGNIIIVAVDYHTKNKTERRIIVRGSQLSERRSGKDFPCCKPEHKKQYGTTSRPGISSILKRKSP